MKAFCCIEKNKPLVPPNPANRLNGHRQPYEAVGPLVTADELPTAYMDNIAPFSGGANHGYYAKTGFARLAHGNGPLAVSADNPTPESRSSKLLKSSRVIREISGGKFEKTRTGVKTTRNRPVRAA